MKASQIISTICAAHEVKQPVYLGGPPGTAKSSCAREAAERLGIEFIDLRLTLLEPIDLRGFPYTDKGQMKFAPPAFLPTKGKGILMLDELVQAPPSMQAAASQLILDRRIGEYKLPDGWHVIAAGNRKSDKASVNAMPTHIANRFVHLTMEVDVDEWIAWALKHDIDIRVIAFIKWRPMRLYSFDPQVKGEAFASPRSWEFVSKLLGTKLANDAMLEVFKGAVGEGAGSEFTGFLRVYERLPSIDTILLNPAQADIPTDPATLYAVTTALTHRADKDNIGKAVTYFNRIADAGRPEFSALALKEISLKKPEIAKTRAYVEWASKMAPLTA